MSQNQHRRAGRDARRNLGDSRDALTKKISEHVFSAPWFRRATKVGCYLSTTDEVGTWDLVSRAWRMKKRIFAPVCDANRILRFREVTPKTELVRDRFGIFSPPEGDEVAPSSLDLVIAPVVAFDTSGNRIGMGGGYYDTTFHFLKHRDQWRRPRLIGLAYSSQEISKIRANPWDIRLSGVVTEYGVQLFG